MDQNYNYNSQFNQFEPINLNNMPTQQKSPANGYALASLILGIAAIVCTCILCCFYYAAAPCAILSIVFAFVAKSKNGGKMPGKAVAGLILAIIAILLFILWIVFEIWVTTTFDGMTEEEIIHWFEDLLGEDLSGYSSDFGNP